MRTCVGCRSARTTGTLVRVALRRDGSLVVSRVAPGRGAWLCRDPISGDPLPGCLETATARHAFNRAYRTEVDGEALRALGASLEATRAERAIIESGVEVNHRQE